MTARIIDGAAIAAQIRNEVKEKVAIRIANEKSAPGLATVLVGENPASQVYVRSKHKACQDAGIISFGYELPASASQVEVEELIKQLNDDKRVHGILVQLPLPGGLDEERVLSSIHLEKDVDGFHPVNIGRLAQKGREPNFVPCTPAGVMYLLRKELSTLSGINAVVLGRSNIVGMPVALLLVKANATVTICHSRTRNLEEVVKGADVLIAAVGKMELVKASWVKPGAIVIDVGINHKEDADKPRGYRLVGDVDFESVKEVAGAITPVPGGVGPMTIAMLLMNTLKAAEKTD